MKEEEKSKKKLVKEGLGPWHGPATRGTGRAKLLDMQGSIFFIFLNHAWTTKQLKTTQNQQNKSN